MPVRMDQSSMPSQGGLLTAIGAHLELLGALLKKADACGNQVPQSSVASMFENASAYVANDPGAKKLASHQGQRTASDQSKTRAPPPDASAGALAVPCPSDSEFLAAATSGGGGAMLSLLEGRADPNRVLRNFKVGRRAFVEGTALGIAAQRGALEAVSALLRHGARPDATYSVTVGAEKTTESFPVGFSTVRGENIELLDMLLDARADLHAMTSSLDATMLWEAAYFGKETMARYVLDRGIDIDAAATSQDNRAWKFTALHAACYKGENALVALLLERGADVEGRNAGGRTPLADAIIKGHGDIVRMLIAARAELFDVAVPHEFSGTKSWRGSRKFGVAFMAQLGEEHTSGLQTPIQLLFHLANDHVIAEAAKGLQVAPRPIDSLTFIRFLAAKGSAPVEIMKAVAQPQELWYWSDRRERVHVQTAMMRPESAFIVGYGPHALKLKAMFDKKEVPTEEVQAFIESIAPEWHGTKKRSGSRRVRGRLMMCGVPGIFFNPEVLLTMVDCDIPEFFEMQGVQAVVNVHWREVVVTANFKIVFQILYCTVSMCLNILLLEFEEAAWRPLALTGAVWVCFAFWLIEVMLALCEMIGFYYAGLFSTVYINRNQTLGWARLCMSGIILSYATVRKAAAKHVVLFNCGFGLLMYVRWMSVLYSFRGHKFFGIYLLPITTCLSQVVPFCAVLFPFVLGFANMYYALGLQSPSDALVIILRLILLGDQNLAELEGVSQSLSSPDEKGSVKMVNPEQSDYYFIVRILMVACAMVMSTAMMNIFIAVLSEQYSEAFRVRYGMFIRSRAALAAREHITWRGMKWAIALLSKRTADQDNLGNRGSLDGGNFVWYFSREDDAVDEALATSLQNHKAEIINEVQKCHSVWLDEVRNVRPTVGTKVAHSLSHRRCGIPLAVITGE